MNSDDYGPIVATGGEWLGGGIGSALSALHALLGSARNEIHVLAYSITSGSDELTTLLADRLSEGKSVTMIVNRLNEQPAGVVTMLNSMTKYMHFHLYSYDAEESDLHAKAVVVDRRRAIVGSSNMSRRGLHQNFELGVIVEGKAAWNIAELVERLTTHSCVNIQR